jgi:hypothetical protein
MLPAGILLAAAALVITPLWSSVRRDPRLGAVLAGLLALAMLAHGGSVFGVFPLVVVAAVRGLPSWRWLGVALAVGVVLMVPWSAYQKWGEPPGNRLLKYQLAGVVETDDRGTVDTIVDSYREAGVGGTLHDKAQNLVSLIGGGPMLQEHLEPGIDALGEGDPAGFVREIRAIFFYNLVPSLGLLLIAPFVMIAARGRGRQRRCEWDLALSCFWVVLIGAAFWVLAIFGDEAARTILHQGSFLLPVLAFCGAVCGLRAAVPRFATWCVGISAALMLALYVPVLEPLPGTSFSAFAALCAVAALATFAVLVLRAPSADASVAVSPLAEAT